MVVASPVRLVREGLVASLRDYEDVTVVAAVDLSPDGVARIANMQADVALVDLGTAEASSLAQLIKTGNPALKLVAFGLNETVEQVFACAAASFTGYVPRESSGDEVHRAVVDAVEGRMHCAPQIAAAMYNRLAGVLRELGAHGALPSLTSRESEIVELVAQGRSNKEIARSLTISTATVKNHMHNIMQKLHVSRRVQVAALLNASRHG